VVRVAGRLGVAHVPELLSACDGTGALEINLTDLSSADSAGIEALQRVQRRGATLVGTPGYIRLKIDALSARSN
jgi:ABC-type transporter Mla MlaB component